ncbi:hypothetical protein LEN26_002612 [Aphanomyces euteiches]|nr:hypothetical protein AeMF1_004364 [Aphanomyces euteiches]KAH9158950.1 hypothetical protein LEN26_002612 [Aphanomyces euteiches]KAH9187794.1 hypothetical protein AeNC1_010226 [Aphanomyces euteiches]
MARADTTSNAAAPKHGIVLFDSEEYTRMTGNYLSWKPDFAKDTATAMQSMIHTKRRAKSEFDSPPRTAPVSRRRTSLDNERCNAAQAPRSANARLESSEKSRADKPRKTAAQEATASEAAMKKKGFSNLWGIIVGSRLQN